jgi:hypothetical protein
MNIETETPNTTAVVTSAEAQQDRGRDRAPGDDGRPELAIGQWFWVTVESDHSSRPETWFGCVMEIGSNYIKLSSPQSRELSHWEHRVHFDDFWTALRYEPDPQGVIRDRVAKHTARANALLGKVKAITARLGLPVSVALPGAASPASTGNGTAMVALASKPDMNAYKTELMLAKDKELPDLFKEIKSQYAHVAMWMGAESLVLQASVDAMTGTVDAIEDRIFSVGLYAGLTESATLCSDGAAAGPEEKLHVMQRRLYMDEECLLNYNAGGMEFSKISEFDAWIAKPENRDRILPFPRTLVAMRVRRIVKERESNGTMLSAFINMMIEGSDKFTFLYVRNGERVWRITSEMDYGEMIFPDETMFRPDEPKMAKIRWGDKVDKLISVDDYQDRVAQSAANEAKREAWMKANPNQDDWWRCPHSSSSYFDGDHFNASEWQPFNRSSVYYDDCVAMLEAKIKEYNRIAVIIQGLYDRSEILHPHPPVKTWTAEGFEAAVKLVFDGTNTLYAGEKPDFISYREQCNKQITGESVLVGQYDFWLRREAIKENKRRDADWRQQTDHRPTRYKPHGDKGPGPVAVPAIWRPKAREAVFTWTRERRVFDPYNREPVKCSVTVPEEELFNVSAYRQGDYKQFFRDPRTRAEYLKWAPVLLAAEDYHAGRARDDNDDDATASPCP